MRPTGLLAFAALASFASVACTADATDDGASSSSAVQAEGAGGGGGTFACALEAPVAEFDVLDKTEARAVAEREYGESPPMVDAIVAALEGMEKEQFPVTFFTIPVKTSEEDLYVSGTAHAVGRVWSWGFNIKLPLVTLPDGQKQGMLPLAIYKDKSVPRGELAGEMSLDLLVRCGTAGRSTFAGRNFKHPLVEEFYCADVETKRGEASAICMDGCGTRGNVKSATVDWGSRQRFEYTSSQAEDRQPVHCECDDGKTFELTCAAGAG